MSGTHPLVLSFQARGGSGRVNVVVAKNTDPASLGTDASAHGFPVCRATVEFERDGYDGLLGWVQVVGVIEAESQERVFAIDPLQVFDGVDNPFAFYGLRPELFDAPSRRDGNQTLDWLAHSFLCAAPSHPMAKEVKPVVGFSWGFVMRAGEVSIVRAEALELAEWSRHLETIGRAYPSWDFIA